MSEQAAFIPALNLRWLTPAYDRVVRSIFPEQAFKSALVREALLRGDERILDVGCGTGTLALELAHACPRGQVIGIDADEQMLERARAKISAAGLSIQVDRGMSFALPYPDAHFDRATSTLMLHHLTRADKDRTFREVFRVLRPGGQFHIGDFGPPDGLVSRLFAHVAIHFEHVLENVRGELPEMLRSAGFGDVREGSCFHVLGGTLRILHAVKAGKAP